MKKNLVKELQRLTKNLTDIETNNNNAVGVLYELNNALENPPLEDDVSNALLPPATAEDEGKVVSVTETGEYGLSTIESGLPVATSEDAGKVVAVDETGAYELVEDKCSTPLVVTFSGTSADDDASCDKTWDEIVAASELVLRYSAPHGMVTLTLVDMRGNEVNPQIVGSYLMSDNPSLHLDRATFERIFVRVESQGLFIEHNFFSVSTKINPQ